MASIKIKFRPSSVRGKEGVLFLQIIHRRVVRQIVTPYPIGSTPTSGMPSPSRSSSMPPPPKTPAGSTSPASTR